MPKAATKSVGKLTRQYRRLFIGVNDLFEAYQFADLILEKRLHANADVDNGKLILRALSLAMIVSYSRPFLNSHSEGMWPTTEKIPERVLKGLTPSEKALHDRIINLRNQELAHSDASMHDAKLTLRTPGDGSSNRIGIGLKRATGRPLSREDTERFRDLLSKVIAAASRHRSEVQSKLPDAEFF